MEFSHEPVLLQESIAALHIDSDGVYVDATAGGGGHSLRIARQLAVGGRLVAIDQDPEAVRAASERLKDFPFASVVSANFSQLDQVLDRLGIGEVDGVLFDLGVSSYQFDNPARGFSYNYDAPLDMRMNPENPLSAREIVNLWDESRIARIIWDYSEEKFARRIASEIVRFRQNKPIETTFELNEIIKTAIPAAARRQGGHPSKRTYQALRIAVNAELEVLSSALETAFSRLKSGGRLAVITFQSLEDRIVKQFFASLAKGCTCPPDFPVCVCGGKPKARLIDRKGITANTEELERNNRAHSARLRTLEKI